MGELAANDVAGELAENGELAGYAATGEIIGWCSDDDKIFVIMVTIDEQDQVNGDI